MIPPNTNLYPSHSSGHNNTSHNQSSPYANTPYSAQQHVIHNMGSQTPTPSMSRQMRSRSVSITTTSSPNNKDYNNSSSTASPPFPGSMTPQHHTSRNRRHTVHGHSSHHSPNNHHGHGHYSHSNQGSPYHNGHGHNNYNKQSRTEKIYSLLQFSLCFFFSLFARLRVIRNDLFRLLAEFAYGL